MEEQKQYFITLDGYYVKDEEARDDITSLQTTVTLHTSTLQSLSQTVQTNSNNISSLQSTVQSQSTDISNLQTDV